MAKSTAEIVITAKDETRAAIASVNAGLASLNSATAAIGLGSLGTLGLGAIAAQMVNLGMAAINLGDEMHDLAIKTGMSVEELGAWRLVAGQSGLDMETIAKAVKSASVYMGQHADVLKELGINATTAEETIIQLAGVLENFKQDDPRRLALAVEVLGKSGQAFLPAMAEGEAALRKTLERGKEVSKLTKEFSNDADRLKDKWAEFKIVAGDSGTAIASGMITPLENVTDRLLAFNREASISAKLWSAFKMSLSSPVVGITNLFSSSPDNKPLPQEQSGKIRKAPVSPEVAALQADLITFKAANILADKQANQKAYNEQVKQLNDFVKFGKMTVAESERYKAQIHDKLLGRSTAKAAKAQKDAPGSEYANYSKNMQELARLYQSVNEKSQPPKLESQKLQEELDAFRNLDSVTRDYVQTKIDLIAVNEKTAASAKIAEELDKQNQALEEQATALRNTVDPLNEFGQKWQEVIALHEKFPEILNDKVMTDIAKNMTKEYGQAADEVTEFWRQAARNMQDAMSNLFFGVMQGKLSNLADDFKATIDRMVANALAAKLASALFGDMGGVSGGGSGGGLIEKIAQWGGGLIGGMLGGATASSASIDFSAAPVGGAGIDYSNVSSGGAFIDLSKYKIKSYDVGTNYVPRDMLAMVHKGEKITPAAENNGNSKNGIGAVVMNFSISGATDMRSQQQIAAAAYAGASRAARRNL